MIDTAWGWIGVAAILYGVPQVSAQDVTATGEGTTPICLVGRWNDYDGTFSDVWGDGDYVYLPNWGVDGNDARVHIIDISNPSNPQLASTFFVPFPDDSASPQDVKVADGLLFIALESDSNNGIAIVDVRDPTNPSLLATVRIPGNEAVHNVYYDSGFLYTPEGTTIHIIDLTSFDPDNPPASPITVPKWSLSNVGSSNVHDITVKDGRLYAAAWHSGLWIYDVSNVATTMPTLIGSVDGTSTHSMWPTDDGNFVVTGEERPGGGIHVYRITENAGLLTLTLTDALVLPATFSVHNQMFVGNRLYNSWYSQGLQIFDINPVSGLLELVGNFTTSDGGTGNWGVYPLLGSDRILLSDTNEGLYIVTESGVCSPGSPPIAETIGSEVSTKNRMLSFEADPLAATQAIRVTFMDLPDPYHIWNGQSLWVGSPAEISQNGGSIEPLPGHETFQAAQLQCGDPVFNNWSQFGTIHVFHEGIVPGGTYSIQTINTCCDISDEVSYSAPMEINTSIFGDTIKDCQTLPCSPPEGVLNINDVFALVNAFISADGAIVKPRADLEPRCIDLLLNITDIFTGVQAFQGLPYLFAPSAADPCGSPCINPLP